MEWSDKLLNRGICGRLQASRATLSGQFSRLTPSGLTTRSRRPSASCSRRAVRSRPSRPRCTTRACRVSCCRSRGSESLSRELTLVLAPHKPPYSPGPRFGGQGGSRRSRPSHRRRIRFARHSSQRASRRSFCRAHFSVELATYDTSETSNSASRRAPSPVPRAWTD